MISILTKEETYDFAIYLCNEFCKLNDMQMPKFRINNYLNSYGEYFYNRNLIEINLDKTKRPTKNPGYSWSYPGWKSDVTTFGVIVHEFGHCIHFTKLKRNRTISRFPKVSGYEPNVDEAYAETFKLFMGNPDLLRIINPERHNMLINKFHLIPVIEKTWDQVLCNAHPKYHTMVRNMIIKNNENNIPSFSQLK